MSGCDKCNGDSYGEYDNLAEFVNADDDHFVYQLETAEWVCSNCFKPEIHTNNIAEKHDKL